MTTKAQLLKQAKKLYDEKNRIATKLIDAGIFEDLEDFEEINNLTVFSDKFTESELDKLNDDLMSADLKEVLAFITR